YGPDSTATTVAGWQPGDPRIFRLQETDLAGNQSELSAPLVQLPSLTGLTLDEASAALAKLGLTIGSVTVARPRQARANNRPRGSRPRAAGRRDRRDRRPGWRRDEPHVQGRHRAEVQAGKAEAVRRTRRADAQRGRHGAALQPAPRPPVHLALQDPCRQHDP